MSSFITVDWPTVVSGFSSGLLGVLAGGAILRMLLGRIAARADEAVKIAQAANDVAARAKEEANSALAQIAEVKKIKCVLRSECFAMRDGCTVNLQKLTADTAETKKDIKTLLSQVGRIEGRLDGK